MKDRPEDWIHILDELLAGSHLAFLKLNGLITGYLARLRAYDFHDEWDDLRQEIMLSIITNAQAGRLRDPQALLAYVRIITRNKVIDRFKRSVSHRERDSVPLTLDESLDGSLALSIPPGDDEVDRSLGGARGPPTAAATSDPWGLCGGKDLRDGVRRDGDPARDHETAAPRRPGGAAAPAPRGWMMARDPICPASSTFLRDVACPGVEVCP